MRNENAKFRRILSFLLMICMVTSMFPAVSASGETVECKWQDNPEAMKPEGVNR